LLKAKLEYLLALAGGFTAEAQSNRNGNGVPGGSDYAQFSRFITDRNIFDPNRIPRSGGATRVVRTRTRTRTAGAPYVTLVGTMSYEKGLFAFFDSNNQDMKKIIGAGDEIGIYTVKDIAKSEVTLTGKDKKEFTMKVGEQMRQEGGVWQVTEAVAVGVCDVAFMPRDAAREKEKKTQSKQRLRRFRRGKKPLRRKGREVYAT